jgi:hypothetical protein
MPEANRLYASLGFVPVERYNDNPVADLAYFSKDLRGSAGRPITSKSLLP